MRNIIIHHHCHLVSTLPQYQHCFICSLDFSILRDKDCSLIRVRGVQKAFLQQLQSTGPFALIQPFKLHQEVIDLGLNPLFTDVPSDSSMSEVRHL